ncbi:MAG: hypothetical protein DMD91_14485 [Candidatus Rokuibacteriota bacterium]|nr:MAG: hypothetical protein DMD91_14485 [Candidatus Rokubacteria bacterium]
MTDPAVVTRGLTKRFGSLVAVDHLDLTVKTGELYGFLGPNGAGKSTTLRMLTGIMEPTEGEGVVLGIDLRHDPERVKSAIGYMSQRFSLYDDLTVDENLTFYARVYMVPRGERAGRIQQMIRLAGLGSHERQLAGHLSGGFRQRLALVCALVHRPRLVFLDEPTAGVDPVSRRTFWALIRRLADEGTTVLVTTHYIEGHVRPCRHRARGAEAPRGRGCPGRGRRGRGGRAHWRTRARDRRPGRPRRRRRAPSARRSWMRGDVGTRSGAVGGGPLRLVRGQGAQDARAGPTSGAGSFNVGGSEPRSIERGGRRLPSDSPGPTPPTASK